MESIAALVKEYIGLVIYPLVALLLSLIFTRLAIILLPRFGYLDKPGGRHIHKHPIPRGGGIAVIIAFFFALACFLLENPGATGGFGYFWQLFLPALILGILGLIDDRVELKSYVKLAVQLGVVLVIWFGNGSPSYEVFGWKLPWFLSLLLTAGWIIIIINAFNLIDGLDGLASGLAVVSSGCMAIWFLLSDAHDTEAMCMLILAGACLGFLHYNFYPARIFLGDTGSTFLGLIFAVVGLSMVDRAVTATSLLLPLLAIGVPIFDVFLAIWRRSTRKLLDPSAGGIMEGDQDHLHHRLLRQNKKQTTTALTMYLIGCGFSAVALVGISLCNSMPAVGYVILLVAVLIVIRKLAIVELYDSTMLISRGLAKPHKGVLVNIVHPFIDFVCIILAYVITAELLLNTCRIYLLFLCAFAPVALLLCVSGVYRVFWLRAGLHNYCHLALVLIGGSCLACVLTYFFCYHELEVIFGVTPRWYLAGCLMFSLLNLVFILLERLLLHYAEGFWFRKLYLQCQKRDTIQRILIYGGGLMCRVYISFLFVSNSREFSEEVVGIIDDDPALQGLQVNGFRVFGSALEIERIYQKCPFDKIVIATNRASEEGLSHLRQFCREKELPLVRLSISENPDA